jgi:hypothetical protein
MKLLSISTALGVSMLALVGVFEPTVAMEDHKIFAPNEVKWSPGPASLPKGVEMAVLFGDPTKAGLFAMRLKMSKGYHIPPHSHGKPEVVTVISGTVRLGMGDAADPSKTQPIASDGFFALSPGMNHYVFMDEDAVIQLNSNGPWSIKYVNPADDPRTKSQ